MHESTDCVLGIGANLGERERTFAWTLEQLVPVGEIVAVSSIYENPAIGGPPQPDFLNAAVRLRSVKSPLGILEATQQIERVAGRQRDVRWGPRTLDIDLLWIAQGTLELPQLRLPHPRLLERAFALQPLIEVAPDASDAISGARYSLLLERLSRDDLRLHSIPLGPPYRWQRVRQRPRGLESSSPAP